MKAGQISTGVAVNQPDPPEGSPTSKEADVSKAKEGEKR